MAKKVAVTKARPRNASPEARERPRCGLCGKKGKLMRTECCGQWICDDQDSYVMFSYARNSCSRNHQRYTLCGSHFNEGHKGGWQTCKKCLRNFEPEMYAYYATNDFNFEKLVNPPPFEPTRCGQCNRVIKLAEEGFSMKGDKKFCSDCGGF